MCDFPSFREEWGNPNESKYFSYMESYSPYDNVAAQDYPAILGNQTAKYYHYQMGLKIDLCIQYRRKSHIKSII